MHCEIGDIVLISQFKYSDGRDGGLHSFVIIDIDKDELGIMAFEYLCFLVSSQKSKESFPYNVPIKRDSINRLLKDSHVKCDYIYEGVRIDDILMVVGKVTPEQLEVFLNVYDAYLKEL